MKHYPVAGPDIGELERAYVADAAEHGWYERSGEWPGRFEKQFAQATGRSYAFSLPSCTSGIHLALAALGIGPGDEVVIPEATWIASAAPISYVGATPVFADIDADTWCLSAASLEACLTPRTRAVIAVDLYGGMPEWEALQSVADRAGVPVIEDAAEAFGATWDGRPAGSLGITSVFSFHGSKTLTTGEGGLLLTDDAHLAERVGVLRDHGRHPGDVAFENREVAFKYKMSALQAALGTAQLERGAELVGKKRELFRWYQERLDGIDGLSLNPTHPRASNAYWMVTVVVEGENKTSLAARLLERGVVTRPFFNPLSDLVAYEGAADTPRAKELNGVAREISPHALNLPSALRLDERDVDEVCRLLRETLRR